MTRATSISTVLRLPGESVAALLSGRAVVAITRVFIRVGQQFALCNDELRSEQGFVHLEAWARCDRCVTIDTSANTPGFLPGLASKTGIAIDTVASLLEETSYVFIPLLRVYWLIQPVDDQVSFNKQFAALPTPLSATDSFPVLCDRAFAQRKHQLDTLQPPLNPELEALEAAVTRFAITHPGATALAQDLRSFLGWCDTIAKPMPDPDLDWISTIATVGNSSDGHGFEKLVRKSLIKLGFTNSNQAHYASLDPEATGGAGGLDVYCEAPYPLVGECKASQHDSVPDGVAAQLIKLGNNHLGKDLFERSLKVIFAAGTLTDYAQRTARENQMSVLRPETLQRLVELKARYPGAINLLDLKACLDTPPFGEEADAAVDRYMDNVRQQLRLRAQLVEATKRLTKPHRTQLEVVEIRTRYEADFGTELRDLITHELLIELSSPLAGYLGRVEGGSLRSDRFYFLRDLVVE